MTQKVHVTLPDSVYREVEVCSELMGRSPANLCAFFVEFCLTANVGFSDFQLKKYRFIDNSYESFHHLLLGNVDVLEKDAKLKDRLDALLSGDSPTTEDKLRIALNLRLSEDYIDNLIGEKTNGDSKSKAVV